MPQPTRILTVTLALAALGGACDLPPEEGDTTGESGSAEGMEQALFEPPVDLRHDSLSGLRAGEGLHGANNYIGDGPRTFISSSHPHLGSFKLQMHGESCELVLTHTTYDPRGVASGTNLLWTSRKGKDVWSIKPRIPGLPQQPKARGCYALFQPDGNFVIYGVIKEAGPWPARPTWGPVWSTETWMHPGASLQLEPTGNLVIYDASGRWVWQSATAQPLPRVITQDGTSGASNHPGCRFTGTEQRCGFPPIIPAGVLACRKVYSCSNDPRNPRTEYDAWEACGVCARGSF